MKFAIYCFALTLTLMGSLQAHPHHDMEGKDEHEIESFENEQPSIPNG